MLELFRRPAGEGDAVGRHQRAVPALRPVVHRQLPAHHHTDWRKNTSTQEIDFCQIYGLVGAQDPAAALDGGRPAEVAADRRRGVPAVPLRAHARAAATRSSPSSRGCTTRTGCSTSSWPASPTGRRTSFFAVGLEHGNSTAGSTALDVLFLREHNRIAGLLARVRAGPGAARLGPRMSAADLDERLFQTTRLIMIVLLLKIVVEEYIRHIAPFDPPLETRPGHGRRTSDGTGPTGSPSSSTCSTAGTCWCPTTVTTDEGPVDCQDLPPRQQRARHRRAGWSG